MNFDEFVKEYQKLKNIIPRPLTYSLNNENSDFTAYTYNSKNCYMCFDCANCSNCKYCFDLVKCSDCMDCDYCVECEMLYNCVDDFKVYNSTYVDYSARVFDSHFCWDLADCNNVFGCTHLKNKEYCIFNKQFTKEAYEAKVKELLARPAEENISDLKELIKKYPFGPTNITNSENSDYGNHIHFCNNCYLCFNTSRSQNSGYLYDSAFCQDSYDLTQCFKAELCYECSDSGKIYNCDHVDWSSDCFDSSYLTDCKDCHNCFGCVGLAHKRFCFLNKQYSETDYQKIVTEVRQGVR